MDDLTEEADDDPPAFLAALAKRDWSTFLRRTWRDRWLESNPVGRWCLFRGAARIVRTPIPEELPAQAEMLKAVRIAFHISSPVQGMEFER